MTRQASVAILAIVLLIPACATVRVSHDYRTDTDFSRYHAYAWQTIAPGQGSTDIRVDNPLLHGRFHQAIDRILTQRGYLQRAPADFLVNYSYSIETRIESQPYGPHIGFGFGRRHRYSELGYGDYVDINQYDVGILAVSFYDAASGTLIWRGIGSERVDMFSTPEETTAFVDKLVTAVLTQFPPR